MPTQPIKKGTYIVTLLKVEVFLIGGWQLLRGVLLWQQADLLEAYDGLIIVRILGVVALIWSGLFLLTAVTAQKRNYFLLKRTQYIILVFVIYSICIQLFVNQNLKNSANWGSTIILFIILIATNIWLISRMKESV